MLTLLFSIAIAGMAEREKRRGWLWGLIAATLSGVIQQFIIRGYWGAVLGFFAGFALMTYANFKYPVKKGVMLDTEGPPP